jgi:hypothetical protein
MSQGEQWFSTPDVIRSTFKTKRENVKVLKIFPCLAGSLPVRVLFH